MGLGSRKECARMTAAHKEAGLFMLLWKNNQDIFFSGKNKMQNCVNHHPVSLNNFNGGGGRFAGLCI